MSSLPPHAITEFQALWLQEYSHQLSTEEATLRAQQVFNLVKMLTEPVASAPADLDQSAASSP